MRLFVALALPAPVQAALAAWGDAAAPPGMRRLPAGSLHVTLAFLGPRPDADADTVADIVQAVDRPVGELSVDGALWLPPKRPRVLSAALRASPALGDLHRDLVVALVDAIGFEPERRPLCPHVTVARARGRERLRATELAPPPALTFTPDPLGLYRSHAGGQPE